MADLNEAVAAAFGENADGFDSALAAFRLNEDDDTAPAEVASEEAAVPPSSEGEGQDEEVTSETSEEGEPEAQQGTGDEPPTSYFGVDLSDLTAEQRTRIFGELQERDKVINRLMQRKAEEAKTPEATPAQEGIEPAQPVEMTDDDLLAAFGLSKDDPMYEVKAEVLLPVARTVLPLQEMVNSFVADRQAEEALGVWHSAFDSLEETFGALPKDITRDDIIEYALENNVLDPEAAFHAVTAGARKMVADSAARARAEALEALKREQAGAVRPRPAKTEVIQSVEEKDVMKAMAEAARIAEERTGFSWKSALPAQAE